jgi:hypothetical protein
VFSRQVLEAALTGLPGGARPIETLVELCQLADLHVRILRRP